MCIQHLFLRNEKIYLRKLQRLRNDSLTVVIMAYISLGEIDVDNERVYARTILSESPLIR